MRQVPSYLLIGKGRLATHFAHYLSLLNITYKQWHRALPRPVLSDDLNTCTHIVILINDAAIEPFILEHLLHSQAVRVHCSGSLVTPLAYGAHPLMSFNPVLYSLNDYLAVPFVIDDHAPEFNELLPGLPNVHWRLPVEQKAKYHALCVMSGNFSCLLWQKLFDSFEHEFNLPASIAYPYLKRQLQNLLHDYQGALTGPLVRNDVATMQANMTALSGDPFQKIYEAFVACYADEMKRHRVPECKLNDHPEPVNASVNEVNNENT